MVIKESDEGRKEGTNGGNKKAEILGMSFRIEERNVSMVQRHEDKDTNAWSLRSFVPANPRDSQPSGTATEQKRAGDGGETASSDKFWIWILIVGHTLVRE